MHELGITQEIVALVEDHARGRKVARVVVEIARLSSVLPDAVRFCFDLCAEGTVAETAAMIVRRSAFSVVTGIGCSRSPETIEPTMSKRMSPPMPPQM